MAVRNVLWLTWLMPLVLALPGYGAVTKLNSGDRQHLLKDPFQALSSVKSLLASVKTSFAKISKQFGFQMADPGQEYQVSDVIMKQGLPLRRFIFGGLNKDYCLLHYERGGRAHSYAVVLFRLSGDTARFVWGGMARQKIVNIEQLRKDVQRNQLSDEANYYW